LTLIIESASLDNQATHFPSLGEAVGTDHQPAWRQNLLLSGADQIFVNASALAQNETLTIAIRAQVDGLSPEVSSTEGTIKNADLGTSTTYDRVI
jgi:hypothetical protein